MSDESDLRALTRQLEELNRIGAALSAERNTGAPARAHSHQGRAKSPTATPARSTSSNRSRPTRAPICASRRRRPNRSGACASPSLRTTACRLPFREAFLDITERSIAGYVALTGETVMLDDAYDPPADVPYMFNRTFDEATGYRTQIRARGADADAERRRCLASCS